jgi:hypothetical protein
MGVYSNIDIDLQELVATIDTVGAEYNLANPDSDDALDGRAILHSRLVELGWLTPTERDACRRSFDTGDGQSLLVLLGGASIGN